MQEVRGFIRKRRSTLVRLLKYALVSLPILGFDLALLFFLTQVLDVYYVVSAAMAFLVATSLNYIVARKHVFKGSTRSYEEGYLYFVMIAFVGLVTVTGLIYIFVDVFGVNYLVSRVLIAGVTGFWNFLMNLYVNFKVGEQ